MANRLTRGARAIAARTPTAASLRPRGSDEGLEEETRRRWWRRRRRQAAQAPSPSAHPGGSTSCAASRCQTNFPGVDSEPSLTRAADILKPLHSRKKQIMKHLPFSPRDPSPLRTASYSPQPPPVFTRRGPFAFELPALFTGGFFVGEGTGGVGNPSTAESGCTPVPE